MKSLVRALGQGVAGWLRDSTMIGSLTQTSNTSIGRGQYLGTNTNDDASAGNVGEYVESIVSVTSPVSMTTGVNANITSISITAGDWDITGNIGFSVGTGTTAIIGLAGSISSVAVTFPVSTIARAALAITVSSGTFSPSVNQILPVGSVRVKSSIDTTAYLVAVGTFSSSTFGGYGNIWARRAR